MRLTTAVLLTIVSFAPLTTVPADVVDHSGTNGSFTDSMWLDQTTGMHGVNPKPADDAYFYAATITASSGSVHLLSGGTFSLSGMFTAVNAGSMTLSGSGTLNLQAVVTDANGFGPLLYVTGAHLSVQNSDGVADVTAAGTVVAATCSGTNGCGFYNGAKTSLTLTGLGGPDRAIFASGGKLTANSGLTGFTLQLLSGSTAVVSSITNSLVTIDGVGSLLTVAGDVSLNPQSINISNGGAATVNGSVTQAEGAPLFVTGSGSNLTVVKDLKQNTVSGTDIRIYTGGSVRVEGILTQTRGNLQVDAANSTLTADQDLVDLGGYLDVTNGGTLTVNGNLVLDGGFDADNDAIGGGGNWTGMGTTISTSEAMFVGNQNSAGANLNVADKAAVKSGNVSIAAEAGVLGGVTMSDLGTIWEVQSSGMSVGQAGTGTFTMNAGAHLTFDTGTLFAIGLLAGSRGTLTCDTASVDATAALVSIGQAKGSTGLVNLTDSDFLVGHDFTVGDGGSGAFNFTGSSAVSVSGAASKFIVGNSAGSAGSVFGSGSLMVDGPMTIGASGSGFLGSDGGVLQSTNAAGLVVGADKVGSGMVVLGPSSVLTLAGPLLLGDAGTATMELDSNSELHLPAGNAVNLTLGGQKGSSGTMTVTSSGSFTDAEPIVIGRTGHGVFTAELNSTINIFGFSAPFDDGGQATITVDSSTWVNTYNIYLGSQVASDPPSTLVLTDGGTMRVGDRMTIFQSGTVTIGSDCTMAVGSGAFGPDGSLRVSTGGILSGFGRVHGQVIVGMGGQIFPGNSPGIFNITGTYEQDAGGIYSAEIGGATAGTGFDQINVSGMATLGGTIRLRLVQGFTPAVGQTFRLIKAGSVTGSFGTIIPPSQAGISVTKDSTGLTATVTSVVANAPVISSPTSVETAPSFPFHYQIAASNSPTSYGASDLPAGLTVDHTTGVISGTPTKSGAFVVAINANNASGSGQADLILVVDSTFNLSAFPASNLLNISTRLNVQTGDNVLIAGFIITGTEPKKVLVRGLGPSLAAAGVTGVLADPVLELHKPDGSVTTNDNWKTTQEAAIIATTLQPTNDLESAIIATLPPGNYTAICEGKNSTSGVGLVEVYDLGEAADSTLANISTRGFVGTGDNVLIGGFIAGGGGGGNSSLAVRAIGPSLSDLGVAGALADPTLDLYNADGAIIESNDNWKNGPDMQALIDAHLAPTKDAEAALIATLAPGNYTAVVRGKGTTTGVALVEAYNLQ